MFGKKWYLPHIPNPIKPGKVLCVCYAAEKNKDVFLNKNFINGPDVLNGLIGTIFRFQEEQLALTADSESMFLQVQDSERDESYLKFLWRTTMNDPVQTFEYQHHVFSAEISLTCAKYALKQVAIDNGDEFQIAAKSVQ